MISIILSTIGTILIICSIYTIRKDLINNKSIVNDLNLIEKRVKEYYDLTKKRVEEIDEIIDSKLEIINIENKNNSDKQLYNVDESISNDNLDNLNANLLHNKIIELAKLGLTKEEIARKLNKGIREIEIILKIHGIKNR